MYRLNSPICTSYNLSLYPLHKWICMSLILGIAVAFEISLHYFHSLFLPFLIMMIVMFIDIILWPTFNNKTTLYKSLVLSNAATDANLFPTFINLSLLFSIIRSSHLFLLRSSCLFCDPKDFHLYLFLLPIQFTL